MPASTGLIFESDASQPNDKNKVNTVDMCVRVLRTLMEYDRPQTLKEIAYASGTTPSTAHRYLHNLMESGMVMQEHRSGKYDLGSLALRLGFAALERIDLVNRAADHLQELAIATGHHVYLVVWSGRGPLVIRWERSPTIIDYSSEIGTVKPLWRSSAGQVFLAFLPNHLTSGLLTQEFAKIVSPPSHEEIAARIEQIRRDGYAMAHGLFAEHHTGISAPVINVQDQASAVVTIMKPRSSRPGEDVWCIEKLLGFCREMSIFDADLRRKRPRLAAI